MESALLEELEEPEEPEEPEELSYLASSIAGQAGLSLPHCPVALPQ